MDQRIRKAQGIAARSEAGKSGALLGYKLGAADETKELYALERVVKRIQRWAPEVGYDLTKPKTDASNVSALSLLNGKITSRDRELVASALEAILHENEKSKKGN
jgi:hypothetical protein